jgi:hypothetical protein
MLLRLAYLGITNALAMLRLLPMSNHDKEVEILALPCATRLRSCNVSWECRDCGSSLAIERCRTGCR